MTYSSLQGFSRFRDDQSISETELRNALLITLGLSTVPFWLPVLVTKAVLLSLAHPTVTSTVITTTVSAIIRGESVSRALLEAGVTGSAARALEELLKWLAENAGV
jgi:hypothetical protein